MNAISEVGGFEMYGPTGAFQGDGGGSGFTVGNIQGVLVSDLQGSGTSPAEVAARVKVHCHTRAN